MLTNSFSFDPPIEAIQKRNPYEIGIRQCADWDKSRRRLLIVCQSVDGRDLRDGEMMSRAETRKPIVNAIKYARKIADAYLKPEDKVVPNFSYTVANFNAHKHLHLGTGPRAAAEAAFADRLRRLIKKIRPTHILFSGDEAMHNCFPTVKDPQYKRGWVHDLSYDGIDLKVTSTLDFYRLLEKQGEYANLLGFWCRHLAHLFLGRNPHDIGHIAPTPVYVDTIEAFDGLMRKFDAAKLASIDTETRNLSVLFNKIYTIQMAFDGDPTTGYVLSVDHPMCHWNEEETLYIKKQLRKRFSAEQGPMLVMFNGMFDLRVIRQQLKIPIIWLPVWEVTFGEHSLDENIGALNKVTPMRDQLMDDSSRFGGLSPILCSYGNDFYRRAKFGKKERMNVGSTDPRDVEFLKYGAMDVVSLLAIRKQQIARSSYIEIAGKNFKPYYVRHMRYQMSDTAHQLSHLAQDGSKIQKSYLRHLLSADSPLKKELKRAIGEFRIFPEVKQANEELLKESGFKASGLFKKMAARWMFKLSRTPHKAKLFFDILGLEHLTETKTGAPAIDKNFVAHYKDKNKIIGLYGEYQALSKLLSTYVKGWYKRLATNLDAALDNHLRPTYSIWAVVTGRLASMSPNLQQIPSRGKLAKIIKRMFIGSKGYLMIRYDYSAHEVRVWSIASGDMVLAEAFRAGQKLRQEFIQTDPIPEADTRLKKYVEEWLHYDKETGKFKWKKSPGRAHPVGTEAGAKQPDAYHIRIEGKTYAAHRLAFLLSWGWLPEEVDHKDNNPHNNVLKNLRPATRLENSRNRRADSTKRSSDFKGVYPGRRPNSWVAQIKPSPTDKVKHLGVFETQEEAHAAYVKAAKKYHKEFANDGEKSLAKDDGDYRHPFVKAKDAIKVRGDIHILNVLRFFGQLVDKDHPLRDAVKAVVFGRHVPLLLATAIEKLS